MNRKSDTNSVHRIYMDKTNNERVERTLKRVAHAIRLIGTPIQCHIEGHGNYNILKANCSHAVNLLEAALQEMHWACEWFEWDDGVCDQIEDSCGHLGMLLAALEEDKIDEIDVECNGKTALNVLAMALATLNRWYDDEQDVSEV